MKLLFVGYLHGFGGAEKMIIALANAMVDKGHDVYLVSLAENNPKYPISENIHYKYLEEVQGNKLIAIKNRYDKLKKVIQQLEPDLIVNFWFQSTYFCAFMGKKIAQKTIYAERGDPFDKEYNGLLGVVRRISFKRIRGFVFQSKGAQKAFGDKIINRSCIIHNPVFVKTNSLCIQNNKEKRIVTVGRLHKQKNQLLLIEAYSLLPLEFKDYILEIYGDGEMKNFLQDKINEKKLSNKIILKGTYSDIHQRIIGASLFVLSSDYEGLPNALLEAMSLGIPCISTDCRPGGAKEVLKNGKSGIIVERGNKQQLAEAMEYLIRNPLVAEQMAAVAKKEINNYLPDHIYQEWDNYFLKIVEEGY